MITTKYIDDVLQRWGTNPTSVAYYGLFLNGKLHPIGNKGIYRRAGDLKNNFLKSLGIYKYRWMKQPEIDNMKEMKEYVEDLIKRNIIEIKQI